MLSTNLIQLQKVIRLIKVSVFSVASMQHYLKFNLSSAFIFSQTNVNTCVSLKASCWEADSLFVLFFLLRSTPWSSWPTWWTFVWVHTLTRRLVRNCWPPSMTLTDPRDRLMNVADPEHIIQPRRRTLQQRNSHSGVQRWMSSFSLHSEYVVVFDLYSTYRRRAPVKLKC